MKNSNDSEHAHIIAIDNTLFNNVNINHNYIIIVPNHYYNALFSLTTRLISII
jgi:hypothetical protein